MTSISLCRDTSPPYPRLLSTVCSLCGGCVHVPVSTVSTQPCSCLPATRKKRRQGTVGDPWGRGPTYSTIMGLGLRASTLAGTWDLRTCVSQQRKDMSYSHWWVPGTSHRQSVSPSILGLLMIISRLNAACPLNSPVTENWSPQERYGETEAQNSGQFGLVPAGGRRGMNEVTAPQTRVILVLLVSR